MQGKTIKIVNVIALLVAIAMVLALPVKKEIWYDESISVLCSKGITYDTHLRYEGSKVLSSAEINKLNTAGNVFIATVCDNSNSFLYNISLHWYTDVFGNTLSVYTSFSRLIAICALIAFFVLCHLLMGVNLLNGLAVMLLAADGVFMGMGHEVRAYIMGILFCTLALLFLFRYINERQSPWNLFFVALFSVAAILSHFLSVYVILVYFFSLLLVFKGRLFSLSNIVAIAGPLCLLGLFFYSSSHGLEIMGSQNDKILKKSVAAGQDYSFIKIITGSLRFAALNFKVVFPALINKAWVSIFSFAAVLGVYFFTLRNCKDRAARRNLHILFAAGLSSTIFLAALCVKSGHLTALYMRYHSFSVPASTLFIVYAVFILLQHAGNKAMAARCIMVVFSVPVFVLFCKAASGRSEIKFSHDRVADAIISTNATGVVVPKWDHALLIQCFLPNNYKVDYVYDTSVKYFAVRYPGGEQKVEIIAKLD